MTAKDIARVSGFLGYKIEGFGFLGLCYDKNGRGGEGLLCNASIH